MSRSVGQPPDSHPLPSVSRNPVLHHPPSVFTNVTSDFDLIWQVCEGTRAFLAFTGIYQELYREAVRPRLFVYHESLSWSAASWIGGGPLKFLLGLWDCQAAVDWLIRKWNPTSFPFFLELDSGGFKFCLHKLETGRRGNKVLLKLLIKNEEDVSEERKWTFTSCIAETRLYTQPLFPFIHPSSQMSKRTTNKEGKGCYLNPGPCGSKAYICSAQHDSKLLFSLV